MSERWINKAIFLTALFGSAAASGCIGGSDAAPPSCAGEFFAVGDDEVAFTGKGQHKSEAYNVQELVLRNRDGESIVIEMYEGAVVAYPADAMDGYTAHDGYRIDVVEAESAVPEGSIGPCARFEVSKLPPGWEPPTAPDESSH